MRTVLCLTIALTLMAAIALASDLDGTWRFLLDTEKGEHEISMTLKVNGNQVSGTVDGGAAVKGVFQSGLLQLKLPYDLKEVDAKGELTITGRLDGGKLTGDWEIDENTGSFEATK